MVLKAKSQITNQKSQITNHKFLTNSCTLSYNSPDLVTGSASENPPLPRNCKRLEPSMIATVRRGGWEGAQTQRGASQETDWIQSIWMSPASREGRTHEINSARWSSLRFCHSFRFLTCGLLRRSNRHN